MVTASLIARIRVGSAIRATPPAALMSAGTRSRAITAHAPASSAILACSGVTTSMITPPFSISANPALTVKVPLFGPSFGSDLAIEVDHNWAMERSKRAKEARGAEPNHGSTTARRRRAPLGAAALRIELDRRPGAPPFFEQV